MSFQERTWKARYTPEEGDDISNDFFVPALSDAHYYYRVSGYFSAGLLRSVARG